MPVLPYDKRRVEDVDTDAEDHIYDDTRYFLMSRPAPVRQFALENTRIFSPYARRDPT